MKTITVLCNASLLSIISVPIELSEPLIWNDEPVFAAVFDEDKLLQFSEEQLDEKHGWWREITGSQVDWENVTWSRSAAAGNPDGIFGWIMETFSLSQPRNVAAVIGDIADQEGMTPVQLFTQLAK